MNLVLIGHPAAGKTRVGKRLAKRLDRPFIDTDKRIVADHGPIAEIFREHGEPYFRRLERAEVVRALTEDGIVSLGGGAVLDADTRRDLAAHLVVVLTTEADAVRARLGGGKRPLVHSIEDWQRLVDERTPLYEALADYTLNTAGRELDEVTEELVEWAKARA